MVERERERERERVTFNILPHHIIIIVVIATAAVDALVDLSELSTNPLLAPSR